MIISTFLGWSLLVSGTVCNAVVLPQQVASSIALEDTTSSTVAQEPSNVDKYIAQWEELYEAYGFHSSARGVARANDEDNTPPKPQETLLLSDTLKHPLNNTLYESTADKAVTKSIVIPEPASTQIDISFSTNTLENNDIKGVGSKELPLGNDIDVDFEEPLNFESDSTAPYYTPPRPSGFVSGSYYGRVDNTEESSSFNSFTVHVFKRDIEESTLIGVNDNPSTYDVGSYILTESEVAGYSDSIEDFFNEDLGLDEYEFGYDDRDAYRDIGDGEVVGVVGVLGGVNPEEFENLDLSGGQTLEENGRRRRRIRKGRGNRVIKGIVVDHCGRPINGTSVVIKNATLETPSNTTLGGSSPRVDSMTGIAARTTSKAMLAMTVFCGMALIV
ncbi:uncharacterized protein SAPINGB_P001944 [Magnusiomyces paraingens]|uniref:Uncharacterized protein n=1 Tax=Magnusiomyces paraingens TaxID=2606893 RepID=A0A5E8BBZ0_9ASCO|nr:uncharacterized protein SAPINGB_P001944 [Saprochaete ingens]VVT48773.1 unnamed protein product [Saprochaete ingens]